MMDVKEEFQILCAKVSAEINLAIRDSLSSIEKFSLEMNPEKKCELYEYFKNCIPEIFEAGINTLNEHIRTMKSNNGDVQITKLSASNPKTESIEENIQKKKNLEGDEKKEVYLNKLVKFEKLLCHELGLKPIREAYNTFPDSEIEEFIKYLRKLNMLKKKRQTDYSDTISAIKDLLKNLEIFCWSDYEKCLLDHEKCLVTKQNLDSLHEWKNQLQNRFEEELKVIANLKEEVIIIWDKLSVLNSEREEFWMNKLSGKEYGKYVLQELQKELKRRQRILAEKIKTEILNLRQEIAKLWEKCEVNQDNRNLSAFNSQNFTEKLLSLHQEELRRLQQLHASNHLQIVTNEWLQLQRDLQILVRDCQNKIDRWTNRGGNLLKEEKQRTQLLKRVEDTESKLVHKLVQYKTKFGEDFCYKGKSLLEQIKESRSSNPKKNKLSKKVSKSNSLPLPSVVLDSNIDKKVKGFNSEKKVTSHMAPQK